jgi:hypothetical protein
MRANVPIYVADRMKALKRKNCEQRRVSEIPPKASAYCKMAEFDRPLKR